MSSPDIWIPFYVGRYLMDTKGLDLAEHGAYLMLLMSYWQTGPLPDDDKQLARILGIDVKVWRKVFAPVLRPFFTEQDGRLHQKRADIELERTRAISDKKRSAANARWGNDPAPNGGGSKVNGDARNHADAHARASPDASADGHAPALHPQDRCICPVPLPSKNNILTFKGSIRAGEREADPAIPEASEISLPKADPLAVAFERGKVAGKLTHREYAAGAFQQSASIYKTAAEKVLERRPEAKPLKGDHLIAMRRAAGMIR